jgi:hypothetical protein
VIFGAFATQVNDGCSAGLFTMMLVGLSVEIFISSSDSAQCHVEE